MIGKLYPDDSFDRLSAYVLQQLGKQAEVLAANGVRVGSAGEMAADFEFQRSTRPEITMAVEHVSLAWLPSETQKLTNEVMTQAALLYLRKRGIDPAQTQWVLARHFDEDHPHCHLLLNRVTNDGGVVPNNLNQVESAVACRKVEAEMGFADAAKIGTANKLAQAEKDGEPQEKTDRLRLKAVLVQALEKHLPTATTVAGLQEALASDGVRLLPTFQKDQLRGVVFTADAYPNLYMTGAEVGPQYRGGQLRKTLAEQAERVQAEQQKRAAQDAKRREAEQQERAAREAREIKQQDVERQTRQALQLEARTGAHFREVLLAALVRQVPGATSIAALQTGLATEGITARPDWQADGQLREILFTAAAFPGREIGGAALGPQYEAVALSQALADRGAQRAAEQREAQELRGLIRAQQQCVANLQDDCNQAEYRGDYGLVAEIMYGKVPEATRPLRAYQEQAQATEAGRAMLKQLEQEDKQRADLRQRLEREGQRALRHPLEEERGSWRSWEAYKERVQQLGFDILEVRGQTVELQHRESSEKFNLVLVQPGGGEALSLRNQVNQDLEAQESARLRAEKMFVDLLTTRRFTSSLSELDEQLKKYGYQTIAQPNGRIWLQHEASGRQFMPEELRPNGQDLATQVQKAANERQAELRRGQLAVGPGPEGSVAERAGQFQRLMEAAGAQVSVVAGPASAGKVVLEYRYEWNGPQLDAVNQALRQVQAKPGTLVRDQREGFDQPEAQWPVRMGGYGRATLLIPDSEKAHTERITGLLKEKGVQLNEMRPQKSGAVALDICYHTQHPSFPALSEMLDRWDATTKVEVQETAYARSVRGALRQPEQKAMAGPEKAISQPAQAEEQQSADEYEHD